MTSVGSTVFRVRKEDVHAIAALLGVSFVYYLLLIFQFPQFYLSVSCTFANGFEWGGRGKDL